MVLWILIQFFAESAKKTGVTGKNIQVALFCFILLKFNEEIQVLTFLSIQIKSSPYNFLKNQNFFAYYKICSLLCL